MSTSAANDLGIGLDASQIDLRSMTRDQIWALTPEQATAGLAAMVKRGPAPPPKSPAGARAELNAKLSNPDWYARYESGSPEARREFAELTERGNTDRIDRMLAGSYEPPVFAVTEGGLTPRDAMREIERLRSAGVAPDAIKALLENAEVPAELYDQVEEMRKAKLGDAEWRARLFRLDANGNPDPDFAAQRELLLMSIVRVQGRAKE